MTSSCRNLRRESLSKKFPREFLGLMDREVKEQTMTAYYEEIMEFWKGEKLSDAVSYFSIWNSKGLLNEEEMETLSLDHL
jgi:hypothetical protein